MEDKIYKEFENAGWLKMRQQLEIELPQKKKKDKWVIWFLFLGLAVIVGYQYFLIQDNIKQFNIDVPEKNELNETKTAPTLKLENENKQSPELIPDKSITESAIIQSNSESLKSLSAQNEARNNTIQTLAKIESKNRNLKVALPLQLVNDKSTSKKGNINAAANNHTYTKFEKQASQSETAKPQAEINTNQSIKTDEQILNPSASEFNKDEIVQNRSLYTISRLDKYLPVIMYTDLRYTNAFDELMHKANSTVPILVSNDKVIKPFSGFFAEASIDYFNRKTVENPAYFASTGNIGYHRQVADKFYITAQTGIVYPYSNHKFFLDNQGQTNASPGNSTAFDVNKSGSLANAAIPITSVVYESARSNTSISNGTLYLSSSDLARISNTKSIQYNFKLSLGYQFSRKFFAESGFDLRDEFKNTPVLISVSSSSNQAAAVNQFNITQYELPKVNYAPRLGIIGLLGYHLANRWSIMGRIMTPSFNFSKSTDQNALPLAGTKQLQLNRLPVNTTSFSVGARFRF